MLYIEKGDTKLRPQDALSQPDLLVEVVSSTTAEGLKTIQHIVTLKKLERLARGGLAKEATKEVGHCGWKPNGARAKQIKEAKDESKATADSLLRCLYVEGSIKVVVIFLLINAYNTDFKSGDKPETLFWSLSSVGRKAFITICEGMDLFPELSLWVERNSMLRNCTFPQKIY